MTVAPPFLKTIRTLSGLGDAVYAAPIVAHFGKFAPIHVETKYPEVFAFIEGWSIAEKGSLPPDRVSLRYQPHAGHNYYADYCRCAGVPMLPFSLPWRLNMKFLSAYEKLSAMTDGRKMCLIKEPSAPHMYRERSDFSITPDPLVMQRWMLDNRDKFYYVSVEHPTNTIKNRLVGIDYRAQHSTVEDYISLVHIVDHVAAQISHLCPLAQALGKPLTLFKPEQENRAGFLKYLTPEMVIVPPPFARAPVEVI